MAGARIIPPPFLSRRIITITSRPATASNRSKMMMNPGWKSFLVDLDKVETQRKGNDSKMVATKPAKAAVASSFGKKGKKKEEVESRVPMETTSNGDNCNKHSSIKVKKRSLMVKDHFGMTALHRACVFGHVDTARLLIEKGASVNERNKIGWTSLHYATANDRVEVAKLLLFHGADCSILNNDGKRAFDDGFAKDGCKPLQLLVATTKQVNDLKGHVTSLKVEMNAAMSQNKAMSSEKLKLTKRIEVYGKQAKVTNVEIHCLKNKIQSLEAKDVERRKLVAQNADLENKNQTLRAKEKENCKEAKALRNENTELQKTIKAKSNEIEELKAELQREREEKEGNARRGDQLRIRCEQHKLDLEINTKAWDEAKARLMKDIAVLTEEKKALIAKNSKQAKDMDDLNQKRNQMVGYYENVMAQVTALKTNMESFVVQPPRNK